VPNNAVKNLRQGQNIGGVGYIVYSRIGPKADLPAFVRLYFGAVWHGGYWVPGLENLLPLLNFLFLNSLTYVVKET